MKNKRGRARVQAEIDTAKAMAAIQLLRDVGVSFALPSSLHLQVVTAGEAAELLKESPAKVRDYCRRGLFPGAYQTEGGEMRIPLKAIQDFQRVLQQNFERAIHQKRAPSDFKSSPTGDAPI